MRERWVIVGAGSAGCVLANRLSANSDIDVVLLDDGPDLVAGSVPAGISGPSFFDAVAEPGRIHEQLLARRTTQAEPTLYGRGRGIGGSSAVNAMVALRGNPVLYEQWGWDDVPSTWDRVAIPSEPAASLELGVIDAALLAARPDAEPAQLTRQAGVRVTSAEAYLWPVLDRPNLTVRADAAVQTIRFDGRRATGVRLADGTDLDADRVIMAAGAIHTPAILLRSGVDTPGVGMGLQDHPSAVFTLKLRAGVDQSTNSLVVGSLLHQAQGDDLIQLLPMNHLGPAPEASGLAALMVALMTPAGRAGTVTVDDHGEPVVDFALLQDQRDLHALRDAVRVAIKVLASAPFTSIIEQVYIDPFGATLSELYNNEAIEAWLLRCCGDYVHASSTCAMGTVVDGNGAVNGYQDLFVCDASVFPTVPDANTHFPTTMLAERLSVRMLQL